MYCISISHRKTPAYIREQYALSKIERDDFMKAMIQEKYVDGCVVLCTCNRSELYFSKEEGDTNRAFEQVISSFANLKEIEEQEFKKYLNFYEGVQAVSHLFKVCSGYDSKVLGEDEILRQVKEAYEQAKDCHGTNYELNQIFQKVVTCAKRIKTDTDLSRVPISVTTLVANEVFHWEKEGIKQVLLIGLTGKIGGDVAKNLICKPNIHILGTVRSHNVSIDVTLKHDQLEVIPYADRYDYINQADAIISATTSPHFTLTADKVKERLTVHKPRLFLDLAMPRDIEPTIEAIDGIKLRNIDYFDTVSLENTAHKLEEADRGKLIIEEEKEELLKDLTFHRFLGQIPEWKALFEEMPLEKILYTMKKNLNLNQMKTVFETFEQLKVWMK